MEHRFLIWHTIFTVFCAFIENTTQFNVSKELLDGDKQYIFGIPENYYSANNVILYISSDHTARVQIQAPKVNLDMTRQVSGGTSSVSLSNILQMSGTSISRSAVSIKSNASIRASLLIDGRSGSSSDSILLKPTKTHSTEFYVFTFSKNIDKNQFVIGVLFDNTEVSMSLKCLKGTVSLDGRTYSNGQTIKRILNAFDALQIQSMGDLTGTHISSSKPISVISGNRCLRMNNACDIVADQITPVEEWDRKYVTSKFENDGRSTAVVKIVASEDGTSIRINKNYVRSLNRGQYFQEQLNSSTMMSIEANKPISVAQFYDLFDPVGADPFMVILPAVDQFETLHMFEVPSGFSTNFLVLYIESSKVDGIRLDNHRLQSAIRKTTNFTTQSFSAIKITVAKGKHSLSHTGIGTKFGALLYGLDTYSSYGMFLGYSSGPSCNPACVNNGICVAENTCHCQLGYYGHHCEQGNGIPEEFKPTLFAPIAGTDDNFMNLLSWYSDPPMSSSNKVCFVKTLVQNAPRDMIVIAESSTTTGIKYGNFTGGPIDSSAGITGITRFACLEVRCPFVTMNGSYKDTFVGISLHGSNESHCHLSKPNPHLTNFTLDSDVGKADSIEFVLEVGDNYGPYYGVYMAIGDRNKAKYLAEHKCYSGREYDYDSYNPNIGVLAEFSC